MLLGCLMKSLEDLDGVRHRFGSEQASLEDGCAEPRDLAVFSHGPHAAACESRYLQTD